MRIAAITLTAAAALMVAGSALAEGSVTDVDYLKASRCRGIAGVTAPDTTALDASSSRRAAAAAREIAVP